MDSTSFRVCPLVSYFFMFSQNLKKSLAPSKCTAVPSLNTMVPIHS